MKRYAVTFAALLCIAQPLAAQTTTVTVEVTQQDTIAIRLVVVSAFRITTNPADVPGGVVLMNYVFQLEADNIPQGHTVLWSLKSGSLPPGLSLQPTTGLIMGVAPAGSMGAYEFVISATTVPPPGDNE